MPIRSESFNRDKTAAVIQIAWNALAILGSAITLHRSWANFGDPLVVARVAFTSLFILLLGLQIVALLTRHAPLAKAPGWAPRAIALFGAQAALLMLLLPLATPNHTIEIASSVIMLAGTMGAIITIWHLNRSFSVFPQARVLVTSGPYRLVRHPLYVCEAMVVVGLSLTYSQPWGSLVALVVCLTQLPRIYFEEHVLSATFPEYAEYSDKTRAIVPFVI
jgi:protein-S-isoprenylcysteine O-methyltransferase Ste14